MTGKHMVGYIGRTGDFALAYSNLSFRVRVVDVRTRYGKVDVCIEPLAGKGNTWIIADNLKLDPIDTPTNPLTL